MIGNAETGDDIDWFRANLQQGEFYKVKLNKHGSEDQLQTPLLIVRDPELNLIDVDFIPPPLMPTYDEFALDTEGPEVHFQASATGDHFFIARSKESYTAGIYQLQYDRTRAPITRKYQLEEYRVLSINRFELSDEAPVADFFSAPDASTEYQVFSPTIRFQQGTEVQSPGTVYSIVPNELEQWNILGVGNGTHELMVRAKTGGKWSQWLKTPVVNDRVRLLRDFNLDESDLRFHFPETLPFYFDEFESQNLFDNFQSINDPNGSNELIDTLTNKVWNFPNAGLSEGNEDSAIQVFLADGFVEHARVFSPDPSIAPPDGIGADIVLNSRFYDAGTSPEVGTREYHELLSALGQAIGLDRSGAPSKYASVMALGFLDPGPFAINFMHEDLRALDSIFGLDFGNADFEPSETDNGFYTNVFGDRDPITPSSIGDSNATLSQQIDLRIGNPSFVRTLPEEDRIVEVAGNSDVDNGFGGAGNDVIFGNGLNNFLSGSLGSDYLQGRSGEDTLHGGNARRQWQRLVRIPIRGWKPHDQGRGIHLCRKLAWPRHDSTSRLWTF